MVRETDQSDFQRRLEERRARQAKLAPPEPPKPPEPEYGWNSEDTPLSLTPDQIELDKLVDKIDIVDAYIKFCGKMIPKVDGSKREGVMVSCPNPAHPDKNPSAWLNLDKQTYYCAGCGEGGDAHDIAAYNLGYPVPGYKEGENFHRLRKEMGEAFGYREKKVPGGVVSWIDPPQAPTLPGSNPGTEGTALPGAPSPGGSAPVHVTSSPDDPDAGATAPPSAPEADVTHLHATADDIEDELVTYPTINWRNIVPEDTFLYEYMKACSNDDAPEEYHFWHGLMALGLAVGRRVTLDDTQPVYGNLLLCVLGPTGTGKSRSRRHLNAVLRAVLPYTEDGTATAGVKLVPVPGSGEHMVAEFSYEGKDPSNNNRSLGPQPVTGLVDFDEMAALLSRANRQGSSLKTTLMAMADAVPEVSIGSLTRGNYVASEPFCSITASTQPKAMRAIINGTDKSSGFLNRWVFAGGKQKQIEAIGGKRSSIAVDLASAIEELKEVRGWGIFPVSIEMEEDAYQAFVKLFRNKIEKLKLEDQTDLLKRIDLMAKKLMLLLTINLKLPKVPLSVVEVIDPILDYMVECYGILNSNIGITVMQDVMTDILRAIERHKDKTGRGASTRDIARMTHRKNYSLEQIKKSLDVMTALDMIELEPKMQGANVGRPTIRYQVTA